MKDRTAQTLGGADESSHGREDEDRGSPCSGPGGSESPETALAHPFFPNSPKPAHKETAAPPDLAGTHTAADLVQAGQTYLPSSPDLTICARRGGLSSSRPSHTGRIQDEAVRSAVEDAPLPAPTARPASNYPPGQNTHTTRRGTPVAASTQEGLQQPQASPAAASTCARSPLAQLAGRRHARPRRPPPKRTAAKEDAAPRSSPRAE